MYCDQLTPYSDFIDQDVVLVGLEGASNNLKREYLYPEKPLFNAMTFENINKRIKVIDNALSKCCRID